MEKPMVVLLTTIMQPTVESESHQDILEPLRTRLFMNAVEEFERPLRRKKDLHMKKDQEEQERKKSQSCQIQNQY
jgi:hypothetical protein